MQKGSVHLTPSLYAFLHAFNNALPADGPLAALVARS